MIYEWDRMRISDILSDFLMDVIDKKFDDYMDGYVQTNG
jgi:hypothetical protein